MLESHLGGGGVKVGGRQGGEGRGGSGGFGCRCVLRVAGSKKCLQLISYAGLPPGGRGEREHGDLRVRCWGRAKCR